MEELLKKNNIRPTKIRIALAKLLLDGHGMHVTVDDVIDMARRNNIKVSNASVYNTLNHFADAGLVRKVTIDLGKAFFDTNLSHHHHFFYEEEGRLEDIPDGAIQISKLPEMPKGHQLKSISIMIKV